MRYLVLCYHDVAPKGVPSGFQSPDAETYKMSVDRFQEHLQAIAGRRSESPFQVLLTFDDGGVGACYTADALEGVGCRGYFFITSNLIGRPGFLNPAQIADLHRRGHVIGSHGATHRGRMSRMPAETLAAEWSQSVAALSGIAGAPIRTGSVPSGFYAPRVAQAAASEGLRQIFTQEPTTQAKEAHGCEVVGRFTMRSWTPSSRVAALVRGDFFPRLEDATLWRLRNVAKSAGGSFYTELRRAYYHHRFPERVS